MHQTKTIVKDGNLRQRDVYNLNEQHGKSGSAKNQVDHNVAAEIPRINKRKRSNVRIKSKMIRTGVYK